MTLKRGNAKKALVLASFAGMVLSTAGALAAWSQTDTSDNSTTCKPYGYDAGYGYKAGYGYGYDCQPKKQPTSTTSSGGGGSSKSSASNAKPAEEIKKEVEEKTKPFLETEEGKKAAESLSGSNLSQEWKDAYLFARSLNITTMPTIQEAGMERKITRIEYAKMMSNYAMNVLGKKPDTTKTCEFGDLKSVNEELRAYATTACQLGIMGIHADGNALKNFDPYQTLKRADFATVLSRVYFGNKYEGGETYYANHIKALNEAGVLKVTTPTLEEVRGYIMIALMRTAKDLK